MLGFLFFGLVRLVRRSSSEPLSRTIALLPRRIQYPTLGCGIENFGSNAIEPLRRLADVTGSAPEFSDEVRKHRTFIARDPVICGQRLLELPRRLPTEESLRFCVTFV